MTVKVYIRRTCGSVDESFQNLMYTSYSWLQVSNTWMILHECSCFIEFIKQVEEKR